MQFKYCPDCGNKLLKKEMGDEGVVPYCKNCEKPLFDVFPTCIIALVVNEFSEVILLNQDYISTKYKNLISGYIKPGETAEYTAEREISEETGINIDSLQISDTYWIYEEEILMIGFVAKAKKSDFKLSGEVEKAQWVKAENAINLVQQKDSASYKLLKKYLNKN